MKFSAKNLFSQKIGDIRLMGPSRCTTIRTALISILVLISLTTVIPAYASALFILEPYAGAGLPSEAEQNLDFVNGTKADTDLDYTALMAGFRLSYFDNGFWLGADYNYYPSQEVTSTTATGSTWTWNATNIVEEKYKVTRSHLGLNVGFRHLFLIWASYYPLASLTVDTSSANDPFHKDDKLAGNGYGAGIGYTLNKHILLNAEYRHYEYKDDGTQASASPTGMKYNFMTSEILLTLAFPFAWGF